VLASGCQTVFRLDRSLALPNSALASTGECETPVDPHETVFLVCVEVH